MRSLAEMFFEKLLKNDVRFVVIGALAATIQGSYLRTEDIDICVDAEEENLVRLAATLNELQTFEWDPHKGEPIDQKFTGEMLTEAPSWMLIINNYRVDVIFEPAGFDGYAEILESAIAVDLHGHALRVASIDDLIRSKELLNRPKDQHQLRVLRRLRDQRQ